MTQGPVRSDAELNTKDRRRVPDSRRLNVLLISTYELGRQPFGLASPAAWLASSGADVACADLAVEPLPEDRVSAADLIGLYIPMHTATRLAVSLVPRLRELNSEADLCFYGLYASMNERLFRDLGAVAVLGGEFEEGLASLVRSMIHKAKGDLAESELPVISLTRQQFRVPDRRSLPALDRYAKIVVNGEHRTVGYTEATRGCKHMCRHCPIVPVYGGRFRVVQPDVVIDDVAQQVASGARHITFGDPDFFNGPKHAINVAKRLHQRFPDITYDVTIKIEHLVKHEALVRILRDTGCILLTSAVESIDAAELGYLDKGHTADDFIYAARLLRNLGIAFNPTFVTFTPWTTLESYRALLEVIVDLELIANVSPVQYAIRLLIPAGSRLLELPEVVSLVGPFDGKNLCYPWNHPDPAVDALYQGVRDAVTKCQAGDTSRHEVFEAVWRLATAGQRPQATVSILDRAHADASHRVPYLTESWYCCAEPTDEQFARLV